MRKSSALKALNQFLLPSVHPSVPEVLHGVHDGADDGLEPRDDGDGLERAEDAEGAQRRERAQVDGDGHVRHGDHAEVQPVPRVAQVREPVEGEAPGTEGEVEVWIRDYGKIRFYRIYLLITY